MKDYYLTWKFLLNYLCTPFTQLLQTLYIHRKLIFMRRIGCKHKDGTGNITDKSYSHVRNINMYLRENVSKLPEKKKVEKNTRHIYPIVHPLKPFRKDDAKSS